MELLYKPDWKETKERFQQWWRHEYFGRCAIAVTAPRKKSLPMPATGRAQSIEQHWYDLDWISGRAIQYFAYTFFGGEALPVWNGGYPGHTALPTFLGSPITLNWNTGWWAPCLTAEDIEFQNLRINQEDRNYQFTLDLLHRGVKEAKDKALVTIGAFGGCGDTLAALRGTERLMIDCIERPEQVQAAEMFLMDMWCEHYNNLYSIIHQADEGSTCFEGLWSPGRFYVAQCDFAYSISPEMYREIFLPAIEKQTRFLDHTLYHVDGVGNFAHVDALLTLPQSQLQTFQILPGAGKPSALHYMDTLKKVQEAGRNLWIELPIKEVRPALEVLSARGLYIRTQANSEDEARQLLSDVEKWSVDRG